MPLLEARLLALCKICGWLALAFVLFATLCPLRERPTLADAQLEHFAAFAIVGAAFALGYPRRLFIMTLIVVVAAFGLEALQLLTPDRHARVIDASVKAAGGLVGIAFGRVTPPFLIGRINRVRGRLISR